MTSRVPASTAHSSHSELTNRGSERHSLAFPTSSARATSIELANTPDIIVEWITQLLSPLVQQTLEIYDGAQVEIRLYANRGRVRKTPIIMLNAGPQELVDP